MNEKILIKSQSDIKIKLIMLIPAILLLYAGITCFAMLSNINWLSSLYDTYVTLGCVFCAIGLVLLIIFWAHSRCELIVTEKNIRGKTLFGKEVVLPLYMVSAYSTRSFLSMITISTSSGITKFSLIKNYREIGNVLSTKINERQDSTANISIPNVIVNPSNSMDDIKKLKDLLDSGIITQEEFEAKKKQLLGL